MIDKKQVLRIAELAQLHLSDTEIDYYAQELTKILLAFRSLERAPISPDIEPVYSPIQTNPKWRADEPQAFESRQALVNCAPERTGSLVKVPPVIA